MNPRILVFSSSRVGNGGYLETAVSPLHLFLGNEFLRIAFIPFASVNADYEVYTEMVRIGLSSLPYQIDTVHTGNAGEVIDQADVIMVGGGNTFKLLHDLYHLRLMELIKQKVNNGIPYIGWSAGSNITGATICTTNDMPIINPGSFDALGFFPFQINPHYYNQPIAGFNGETRNQRLSEFLQLNPKQKVVALPEGTALISEGNKLQLTGINNAVLLERHDNSLHQSALVLGTDISYLIN